MLQLHKGSKGSKILGFSDFLISLGDYLVVFLQGPLSTKKWSPWVFPFDSAPSLIPIWLTLLSLFQDPKPSEWNETFLKSPPPCSTPPPTEPPPG